MSTSKQKSSKKRPTKKGMGIGKGGGTRRPVSKREWALAIAKWGAIVGLVLSALGAATLAICFWYYASDSNLPSIEKLREYEPAQVHRVVTADGSLIGEVFQQRRTVVSYEDMPQHLVDALISAEDKGFWKHEGINYIGMMRAVLVNVRSGSKRQGASTITQQVVKNMLLTRARTFRRKFQEIILARRLEKAYSKKEILMLYANENFFDHNRYGVQEASRYYFGKNVQDINIGESAVLAAMQKNASRYSPRKTANHERAKTRQVYVLQEMANNGYLTVEEAQHWIDTPIAIVGDANPELGAAPEFVELAKQELLNSVGKDALAASNQAVVTTVDLKIQGIARDALRKNLHEYDVRKGYGHPIKQLKESKIDLELVRMTRRLGKKGPKAKQIYRAIVLAVHDADKELTVDLGGYKASVLLAGPQEERFNPEKKLPSGRFKRGSVIRVVLAATSTLAEDSKPVHNKRRVELASGPEGAVVVIDPHTRHIKALIGGYDIQLADFNRATMAKRQAGSTFKPFVYAAAIDSGDFTAASIVNDAAEVYELWKPENHSKEFAGRVRLRYALEKSINTVSIRVTKDLGPSRVSELAHALGVHSKLPEELSLALGSGEVTPLELTNAFASIAAGGKYAAPQSVVAVGQTPILNEPAVDALRPEVAGIVLDMMRTVMTDGTGARAASLGLDLAGKTGTSNSAKDAWFVGMSPELVVGVWVGFDDFSRELGRGEGGSKTALPVFVDIMRSLGKRSSRFVRPPGIVEVRIDKATGLLAAPGSTDETSYAEVFLEGTAPREVAVAVGEVTADDAILDQYGEFEDPSADAGDGAHL